MTLRIFQITVAIITFSFAFSQVSGQRHLAELSERIGTTRNFSRIQEIAKTYFEEEHRVEASKQKTTGKNDDKEAEEEFESPEGFYNRWAWYNGARLDANGNVTDYAAKNIAAMVNELPAANRTTLLSSNSNWALQGPSSYTTPRPAIEGQGRVDCIAFHPTNASIMYAGTPMGGLWKTDDEGFTWRQVSGLFPFTGIAGVVVNRVNGNEIWALAGSSEQPNTWGVFQLSGGCRIYHSTDGGISWQSTGALPGIGNTGGYDLIQDPTDANTLYAATGAGVYVTRNGGTLWTITTLAQGVWDLEIHPIYGRLYAVGFGFVKWSDNEGADWDDCGFDATIANMNRASLAISPTGSGTTVYLLAGPATAGNFYGLYKSTNYGINFYRQSSSPNVFDQNTDGSGKWDQSGYDNCIVAHPTDAAKILTGGAAIWQSTNSGVTMTFNTYYWSNADPGHYVHPDIHSLKRNPLNNNVYACTDGGIYRTTNFGTSWVRRTDGLAAAQIFHMATYKNNFFMESFGSQDNGIKIRRNNGAYEQLDGGDGYATQFSLNDSSIMYYTANENFKKYGSFGFTDMPVMYPFVTSVGKWYILPKVTPSATNTEILFAAALDTLSRSTTGGSDWTKIVRRANWDIAYAPSNPAYIYTAGGETYSAPTGLQISRNQNYGTGTWTNISGSFAAFGQRAMKIVVDPFDALKIYVCFGGYSVGHKVYRSTNGGTNWSTNISYNLPNVPVNSLATDKGGNVYAGTDVGVYVLPNGATQWVAFYNSLPRVPVTDLIVNDDHQFIKASTFGTGIWKSNLYSICPQTVTVAFTQSGRQTIEASEFVNAFQVNTQGGYELTDIRLRAGDRIIFTPGSDLKNGSLIASIGPCGEPFSRIVPVTNRDSLLPARLHAPNHLEDIPVIPKQDNDRKIQPTEPLKTKAVTDNKVMRND